jgi:hypothetical protein
MKEETIKSLIEKYKLGTSSLQEEEFLFNNTSESDTGIKTWSTFVKNHKKEAPENFNNTLWESFEKRNIKNNKFRIGVLSAAASIVLIISLYISINSQNELTDGQKKVLLNEAKNMFLDVNQEQITQNIIIENELIVVYTKSD